MTAAAPRDGDSSVYRVERADGSSPFVLVCDHAGREIPPQLGTLGLAADELATHIASDLGIAELGQRLSARLDAVLVRHRCSRLVIDVNRPPGSPESIVTRSAGVRVPGNEGLSVREARQRCEAVFDPYHRRIRAELDGRAAAGRASVLVALHSFTPCYAQTMRRWHVGVLYGRDRRFADPLLELLRRDAALVVGENEPYSVSDATDYTIVEHGERRGIPHVELEIRQDLLADEDGQASWTERLAAVLEQALPRVCPTRAVSRPDRP